MFCVKCGSQIADGAKVCPVCGNVIEMEPKSAAPEVPEAPQPAAEPTPVPVQPVYQEPVQQPVQPPVQPVPQPEPEPKPVYRAEDDEDFSPKQVRILVRTMAVISYLGATLFFPMFVFKEKPWIRHHVNNGLVLFIFGGGAAVIMVIPIVGWILGGIVAVFVCVLEIMGIIKSIKGQMFDMPWFFGKIKILK